MADMVRLPENDRDEDGFVDFRQVSVFRVELTKKDSPSSLFHSGCPKAKPTRRRTRDEVNRLAEIIFSLDLKDHSSEDCRCAKEIVDELPVTW